MFGSDMRDMLRAIKNAIEVLHSGADKVSQVFEETNGVSGKVTAYWVKDLCRIDITGLKKGE